MLILQLLCIAFLSSLVGLVAAGPGHVSKLTRTLRVEPNGAVVSSSAPLHPHHEGVMVAQFDAAGGVDVQALPDLLNPNMTDADQKLMDEAADRSIQEAEYEAQMRLANAKKPCDKATFPRAVFHMMRGEQQATTVASALVESKAETENAAVSEEDPKVHRQTDPSPTESKKTAIKEKYLLPAWTQASMCAVLMLLGVGLWWKGNMFLNSPVPHSADSARLAVVLQEALDKLQSLEEQLETHQEVNEMFADSEPEEELDAAAAEAASRARDLEAEATKRMRQIHEAAANAADQSGALLMGSERAKEAFAEVLETTKERVEDLARTESAAVYAEVNKAVSEPSSNVPPWEPPDWMNEEGTFQLPPLMQLISGMFASSQIRATRFYNQSCMMVGLIMMTISVVTFVSDWKRSCHDMAVWVWHIGLLSLTAADTLCRSIIVRSSSDSLEFLRDGRAEMDKAEGSAGGGWLEFFGSFQRRSSKFFDAFFKYHTIVESWSYTLASVCSFLALVWGAVGLAISIQDAVEDSLACGARLAVLYLHVYSFIYVMLLSWNLMGVGMWILTFISGSDLVRTPLVKIAKSCDDDTMKGMPVLLSLTQSFVLKDSSEVCALKARQVMREICELQDQCKELEYRLCARQRAKEHIDEQHGQIPSQQEFAARCQRRVTEGLDELKPIVGLIAANVTTTSGPDPTAAGSSGDLPSKRWGPTSPILCGEEAEAVESF